MHVPHRCVETVWHAAIDPPPPTAQTISEVARHALVNTESDVSRLSKGVFVDAACTDVHVVTAD